MLCALYNALTLMVGWQEGHLTNSQRFFSKTGRGGEPKLTQIHLEKWLLNGVVVDAIKKLQ